MGLRRGWGGGVDKNKEKKNKRLKHEQSDSRGAQNWNQ